MQIQTDKCALCGEAKELQNSHYMPKALYNIARQKGGVDEISAPIRTDSNTGNIFYDSNQFSKYLLCKCCEERFNKCGENIVCKESKHHDKFILREKFCQSSSTERLENTKIINIEAYAYFALSIIWRGSITEWGVGVDDMYDSLGAYEHPIRLYLLGEDKFPQDILVRIFINTDEKFSSKFSFPERHTYKTVVRYEFSAPGIFFRVKLRNRFAGSARAKYQAHSIPISFEQKDFESWEHYKGLLARVWELNRVGKLAKKYP